MHTQNHKPEFSLLDEVAVGFVNFVQVAAYGVTPLDDEVFLSLEYTLRVMKHERHKGSWA